MRLAREPTGARATPSTYERDRAHVLAVLARRCGWLDHGEREAILHDAYLVLLQKQHDGALDLAAMHEHQVRAYLIQTALHKALDEGKRAGRTRESPLDLELHVMPADDAAPDERAVSEQTGAQVREIVTELPERQQTIVKLRFFFDRTPEEIQDFLGISERAYRRELERAMRQLSEGVERVLSGRFCESRRSAILALIAGIAGPNRAQDARAHLASCPACAHWAVAVRDSTREAAAVLPLPALALVAGGPRLGRFAEGLRESLTGSASSAKQHAVEVAVRLDPSAGGFATAARPGALAAAVAGCLALGGGATYCVVAGVPDPVKALAGRGDAAPERDGAGSAARTTAPQPLIQPATGAPLAPPLAPARRRQQLDAALAERRRAARARARRERAELRRAAREAASTLAGATSPEQAAAQEFGAEGSGVPVAPAPSPTPAPSPSDPAGDEFGP